MPPSQVKGGETAEKLASNLLEQLDADGHSAYIDILPPLDDPKSFATLPHRWTNVQLAHAERLLDAGAVARIRSERDEMAKHDPRMQVK